MAQNPDARNSDFSRGVEVALGMRPSKNEPRYSVWPTPAVADIEGGRKSRSGARSGELLLNGLAATWSTPRASDGEKGGPNMSFGAGGQPLPAQAAQAAQATWATPSARDWKDTPGMSTTGVNPDGSTRTRLDQLPRQVQAVSGTTTNGSPEQTERRGALAPVFVAWLMGVPADWFISARTALQTMPKRSRSSSKAK
jgi:hypothetical protein